MIHSLESADQIAKLVLASAVIVSYTLDWISGRFAVVLLVLASIVIISYIVRIIYKWMTMD